MDFNNDRQYRLVHHNTWLNEHKNNYHQYKSQITGLDQWSKPQQEK